MRVLYLDSEINGLIQEVNIKLTDLMCECYFLLSEVLSARNAIIAIPQGLTN